MKSIIIFSLISFLIFPLIAFTGTEELPEIPVLTALYNIARWLWTILLIVAVISIIVGAYYFVTSAGNPDNLTKAKSMVLYAVIGLVVAGMAWGVVSLARKIVQP